MVNSSLALVRAWVSSAALPIGRGKETSCGVGEDNIRKKRRKITNAENRGRGIMGTR